jgi:PAS domain S-box-containing protein
MQDPTADENIVNKDADWYGLLSDLSPVGIFFTDPSGHCLDVNRRWCEMTGLTPGQARGRKWIHSIHSEDLERVAALWYAAVQKNQPFHAEFRCITPSGKMTWVVGNVRVKSAEDGSVAGYIGTITDLGASRLDLDLLRHGGQRIRTIIAHMPVLLFAFDKQGRLCAWNHEAERVTGYTAQEMIDNPDAMQLLCPDPDYRQSMLDAYRQRGNDYRDWDWLLTAKDGTVKTISFSNISKYYPLEGWANWGVGVDVTHCRATERELRERVKELTCLYQLSITSNRPNLDLDEFLQEAVDLLPSGFQYSEISRARIIFEDKIFTTEPFRASGWKISSELNVRGRKVGLVEVYYLEQRPAMAEGPFLLEERLLLDEIALQISRTIGHLWARRDLGLLDELAAKNEELEEFSHTISHDLKTPLTAIGGFAQFLHKQVARGNRAEALSCTERIIEIVGRMENRLNQILMLARIGKVIDPNEKINFREIAEETVEMLTRRFAEARIAVELDDDFPAVLGHRTRLLEVIEILLDNAIKFIVQPPKRIHIGCRHENDNVVFFVADNGIGIDPQDSETIFELFQRLDKNSSGEGTGLAIARRIIEAHGGKIWVESDGKGKGACFCFTLGHVFEEDLS